MKFTRSGLFHLCPKTGKVVLPHIRTAWKAILFPVVGLASLIWFLVRVVPKPSRASYPCQRVAAPLASSFVLWLLGISGSALAFRKAEAMYQRARTLTSILCAVIGVAGIAWAVSAMHRPAYAEYPPHLPNQPIGVARGLYPGRVVWVHDPAVTDWLGPNTGERWYEHVDQAVANRMVSQALHAYTDVYTDVEAWSALFQHFNDGAGYTPGEKIAIKINLTTVNARTPLADEQYDQLEGGGGVTFDSIANAPQLLHALLDQLVNVVGVDQSDITIGDPTGLFINYLYNPLHTDFPGVHYWDNRGTLGRTRTEFGAVPFYWSTSDAAGTTQDYLPLAFEEATYIINFAVLKSHQGSGITVNAKNHFGTLLRCPDGFLRDAPNTWPPPYNGYYHMHHTLPGDGFRGDPDMMTMGQYRALVDLMGHEGIGGKTLLYLIDGLFGGQDWYAAPSRWAMPPFNDDWPSSLFLSMDPVAIESVARDFLSQQWPEQVLMYEGVEDHLHEAALADNPPSGTFYDPENDGTPLASLGVHEHWNNANDKQYSRNLGTGDGIELVNPAVPADLQVCPSGCAYSSIQAAVDAASDGDVIKVATGTYTGVSARAGVTQVVYITKSVTIRGGYTTAFTEPPDPEANPTMLDAQEQGRVLYITGNISPTVEGLRITGGYVEASGGGLYVYLSDVTLSGVQIIDNSASSGGGGVFIWTDSSVTFNGGEIINNSARNGGGVGSGGTFTLINSIVSDNRADDLGSGLYIEGDSSWLLHTTIARNLGGDGSGVHVAGSATVAMTNTIVATHTVGITVTAGSTATLESTLWHGNTANWGGAGTIIHSNDHTGDPAFVAPDAEDYHINSGSAAIDKGVDLSGTVDVDIDDESRPAGDGYDIGADEFWWKVYLPLVLHQ